MHGMVTVQATPTVDSTITAQTTHEQLTKLRRDNDRSWQAWLWNNAATIVSSFLSTLVVVGGGVFALIRWLDDRQKERKKRDEERQADLQKQEKERFDALSSVIAGLGDEKEGTRVGAAIMLRTIFLRPGYEQFYAQIFDFAVAHLRILSTLHSPEDLGTPLPLTALRQALIAVFTKAYPLARDQNERDPQSLDASHIRLDNAYLRGADLRDVQMREAILIYADLRKANLSHAYLSRAHLNYANLHHATLCKAGLHHADLRHAYLRDAHLNEAYLKWANFDGAQLKRADLRGVDFDGEAQIEGAADLREADLRGAKGLTKEQLEACKAKGAIIDEDSATSASQPTAMPPSPSQDTDAQASSASSTQGSLPTPDADQSSAVSPQQEPEQ